MRCRMLSLILVAVVGSLTGCYDTDNPMVGRHKALLAEQQQDYERAIAYREEVLEKFPDYPFRWEVTYEQGLAYLEMGEPEKALEYFDRTIEIDPQYNFAYIRRAQCYERMGVTDKAIADGNHALEISDISQEFGELFLTRGSAYAQRGEMIRASHDWNLALEIMPNSTETLYHLASYYLDENRAGEALPLIDRFLEIRNQDPEVSLMRAIALADLNRPEEAAAALSRARELDPEGQMEFPETLEQLMAEVRQPGPDEFPGETNIEMIDAGTDQALQEKACAIGREYLTQSGYQCADQLPGVFDFIRCEKDAEPYQIRVKAVVKADADSFSLTEGELNQMMQQDPPAGLIVVTGLVSSEDPSFPTSPGGRVSAFTKSWRPDPARLQPVAYRYPLPQPDSE
ncbi:tetratricopeptide repeat protein [Rubinisphaera margarita]|uniref:tetratricopeptide repeat protein n=1 Tax=Rubinisphaera margarita TaxID=2909586 RepID=UPI001EE9253B|nr:tetratricopeptide repeat protein [Rubinisphaera margarita]MCG6157898.1 tetratricopeptide repeat protein [Rubinisphaera margarita]